MAKHEIKTFGFKADGVNEDGTFSGYLSVFDVEDSYGDIVKQGAFKRTLKNQGKFPLLDQHNPDWLLGDFTGEEDGKGLYIEGGLELEVQRAREKRALMRRGILTGLSIGFETVQEEWDKKKEVRLLKEIKLWEGSLVTFPANDLARIDAVKTAQQFERIMSMIQAFKEKDSLSDEEKELIYKAGNGLLALIGDEIPLPVGTTGDTSQSDDSQRKDSDPEILHSLPDFVKELTALNSIFGG